MPYSYIVEVTNRFKGLGLIHKVHKELWRDGLWHCIRGSDQDKPQEKKIQKDRFTVAQKIAQIKDTLIDKKEFKFTELFEDEDNYSKSEIINTFLALLELLKRQYIYVKQDSLFDEIEIIRNDDIQERLTEEDIGSEYDGEN